ncbi:hypothetical protein [Ornithinimicrobium kibberense]|uniref:Uncharacterized protein n=1 Tax=Ornithinimicrobium kibberense TaxID=282060 RepID=A0ABV5V627_9MICO|nr:hypothetical protein [Ornithinimicrobium kibberense]
MRPFLHDRRARYVRLLQASTEALRVCIAKDLDAGARASTALETAAREYAAMGESAGENELVALQAQLASARDGVDPATLARVTVRRRELERSVALRVLLEAGERLRGDEAAAGATLERTREQLAPLVVHALGQGYVVPGEDGSISQTELVAMWHRLLNDATTGQSARLVALGVAASDVVILLGDLLASLSGPGEEP